MFRFFQIDTVFNTVILWACVPYDGHFNTIREFMTLHFEKQSTSTSKTFCADDNPLKVVATWMYEGKHVGDYLKTIVC